MKKVLLVFWPKKGNVDAVADKIIALAANFEITKISIDMITTDELNSFDNWIVGGSTVGSHTWEDADDSNLWLEFFKMLDEVDFSHKTIAFYGLGDQILYPHHFVNELGIFQEEFDERNARIIGQWPTEGYNFSDSDGMKDGNFFGLALDEDHQQERTSDRIEKWLAILDKDFS